MGVPRGPNFPWLPLWGPKQDNESSPSLRGRLVLSRYLQYHHLRIFRKANLCRNWLMPKGSCFKKTLQKNVGKWWLKNGNNCVDILIISIATLSTRFFSENCLQTPLSSNTKNNLQYFRSLFWKKLIENNKESYCRPTKLTPKIWVPNSKKKHPKKSLAKRNPPLVSTQETVFVVTKFCPNPKCYIWSRAPRTHSSIRTSPNPGEKKIKFGGETEKPSSEHAARATKTLVTFHSTDCFRRTLLIVYYNLHNAAKWSKNLTMSV